MGDHGGDQFAGQRGGRLVPLALREMALQDGLRGALTEVGFEDGGEGQAASRPTATLAVSLQRRRR